VTSPGRWTPQAPSFCCTLTIQAIQLLVQKQRNGPSKVNLVFLREFTKFENRTNDLGDDVMGGQ
jgi:replicative DNA helicase